MEGDEWVNCENLIVSNCEKDAKGAKMSEKSCFACGEGGGVTQKARKAQNGSPAANGLGHTDYTDYTDFFACGEIMLSAASANLEISASWRG